MAQAHRFTAKYLLLLSPHLGELPTRTASVKLSRLQSAMWKQPFSHALDCKLGKLLKGSPYFKVAKPPGGKRAVTLDVAALVRASGQALPPLPLPATAAMALGGTAQVRGWCDVLMGPGRCTKTAVLKAERQTPGQTPPLEP